MSERVNSLTPESDYKGISSHKGILHVLAPTSQAKIKRNVKHSAENRCFDLESNRVN